MIIGMEGFVKEKIDNVAGTGAVSVGGKMWTARSINDGVTFEPDEKVVTRRIEGVKLIVSAAEGAADEKEKE
jgi:membrane protein implicated in regulation of membrane protease activity